MLPISPYYIGKKNSSNSLSKLEVTEVTLATPTRRLQWVERRLQEVTPKVSVTCVCCAGDVLSQVINQKNLLYI